MQLSTLLRAEMLLRSGDVFQVFAGLSGLVGGHVSARSRSSSKNTTVGILSLGQFMHFVPEARLPHHGPFPTRLEAYRDEKIDSFRYHSIWSLLVNIDFCVGLYLLCVDPFLLNSRVSFRRRALSLSR